MSVIDDALSIKRDDVLLAPLRDDRLPVLHTYDVSGRNSEGERAAVELALNHGGLREIEEHILLGLHFDDVTHDPPCSWG